MFSIIPLFLIIVSLGAIVVIVARKYPELTLLDLDTIPDRKEKQKKKEILSRKASQRSKAQQDKLLDRLAPVKRAWDTTQSSFRTYVKKLKDDVESAKQQQKGKRKVSPAPVTASTEKKEVSVEELLRQGERALEEGRFQEAESICIRAIEKDQKYAAAYVGLGDVYRAQQQFAEAKETYLFAKKLDAKNVSLLVKLATLAEEAEDWGAAIGYYQEAVLVEDTNASMFAKLSELLLNADEAKSAHEAMSQAVELNPKHIPYLDKLAELSIMVQDQNRAEEAVQAIRMIDPAYSRLDLLKDRIAEMKEA